MEIIRAAPEQAPELSSIAIAAKGHWGYPSDWMETWAPLLTLTPEYIASHEVWAIQVGPETIGFYSLTGKQEKIYLENMWVHPRYIGQGAGRRMFLHALSRSRELGYRLIQIEADPHAQGFYERMGAHKIGEHAALMDGRPRVLPVLEMELE